MDFKTMKIEDIISWCQANNEVAWLKETAAQKVPCKVYPKVNGKADKTQEPTVEMRPITFIQLKMAFVKKFMPEIAPKAKAQDKKTMFEMIAAL